MDNKVSFCASRYDFTTADQSQTAMIETLSELSTFIDASEEIPVSRKRYLRSALNRAEVLAGNGLAEVRADPKSVLRQLERLSPAMAGLAPQSYANLKSRVREAFRHAAPQLALARSHTKLSGDWAALEGRLQVREQRQLSRFLRFAQGTGRTPDEVDDGVIDEFGRYLEDEAMRSDHAKVVRATRRAWIGPPTRSRNGRSNA